MIALLRAAGDAASSGPDFGDIGAGLAVLLSAIAAVYGVIGQQRTSRGDQSLARLEALTENLQEDNQIVRDRCDRCETHLSNVRRELRRVRDSNRRLWQQVQEIGGTPDPEDLNDGENR